MAALKGRCMAPSPRRTVPDGNCKVCSVPGAGLLVRAAVHTLCTHCLGHRNGSSQPCSQQDGAGALGSQWKGDQSPWATTGLGLEPKPYGSPARARASPWQVSPWQPVVAQASAAWQAIRLGSSSGGSDPAGSLAGTGGSSSLLFPSFPAERSGGWGFWQNSLVRNWSGPEDAG